jgi:hypothetical protein
MNGVIICSLNDIPRGYEVGDKITVYEVRANQIDHFITPSANLSRPNWFQIEDCNENEVTGLTPGHSEIRLKIDQTQYPNERHDLTITRGS